MKFKENPGIKYSILIIGILTGFIFIVTFSSLYVSDAIRNNNACGCAIPIPYMILILSSLGLFVGSIVYYFIFTKFINQQIKDHKLVKSSILTTLNLLPPDERKIVKILINNKSGLRQSDIEKHSGFHKVKVHRVIQKLLEKEIIQKSDDNNVKKINLNDSLKKLYCK